MIEKSARTRLAAAWNDFWFASEDPLSLGVLRVLAGGMLVYTHFVWGLNLDGFFGPEGWHSTEAMRGFAQFQDEWLPSLWWMVPADSLWLVHTLCFIPLVLFVLGAFTPVTSVMALIIMISNSNRAPLANYGMDQILSVLMLYLVIGGSGHAFSLDAVYRRWRWHRDGPGDMYPPEPYVRPRTARARLGTRLIQVHFCIIYFFAGISKLQGESWWNGEAIWRALANQEYQSIDMTWLAHYPWVLQTATHLTILWEISFPFIVWNRTLRPFVLAIGVFVHAGIGLCMGMITFGLIVMFGYLAFVPPEKMQSAVKLLQKMLTREGIVDWSSPREMHPIFVDDVADDDRRSTSHEPLATRGFVDPISAAEDMDADALATSKTVLMQTIDMASADTVDMDAPDLSDADGADSADADSTADADSQNPETSDHGESPAAEESERVEMSEDEFITLIDSDDVETNEEDVAEADESLLGVFDDTDGVQESDIEIAETTEFEVSEPGDLSDEPTDDLHVVAQSNSDPADSNDIELAAAVEVESAATNETDLSEIDEIALINASENDETLMDELEVDETREAFDVDFIEWEPVDSADEHVPEAADDDITQSSHGDSSLSEDIEDREMELEESVSEDDGEFGLAQSSDAGVVEPDILNVPEPEDHGLAETSDFKLPETAEFRLDDAREIEWNTASDAVTHATSDVEFAESTEVAETDDREPVEPLDLVPEHTDEAVSLESTDISVSDSSTSEVDESLEMTPPGEPLKGFDAEEIEIDVTGDADTFRTDDSDVIESSDIESGDSVEFEMPAPGGLESGTLNEDDVVDSADEGIAVEEELRATEGDRIEIAETSHMEVSEPDDIAAAALTNAEQLPETSDFELDPVGDHETSRAGKAEVSISAGAEADEIPETGDYEQDVTEFFEVEGVDDAESSDSDIEVTDEFEVAEAKADDSAASSEVDAHKGNRSEAAAADEPEGPEAHQSNASEEGHVGSAESPDPDHAKSNGVAVAEVDQTLSPGSGPARRPKGVKPSIAVCDPDWTYRSFAHYLKRRGFPTYVGTTPVSIWKFIETHGVDGAVFFVDRMRTKEFELLLQDLTLAPLNEFPVVIAIRRRSRIDQALAMESDTLKVVPLPQTYRGIRQSMLHVLEAASESSQPGAPAQPSQDSADLPVEPSEVDAPITHSSVPGAQ